MKKSIMFLAFAALVSMNVFAQNEAEALQLFNQGKELIEKYDALFGKAQLDPAVAEANRVERTEALLTGFDVLQQALRADSIPELDKKTGQPKLEKDGSIKYKTKNSKKIIELLSGHFSDIGSIADECLNGRDYATACRGYKAYADLADAPFAKKSGIVLPDSTKGLVRFYEAVSAYEVKDYAMAYEAINQALALNYKDEQVMNYFNASIQEIVQPLVDQKDYDGAIAIVDRALSADPSNYYPYLLKGSVVENKSGIEEAMPFYHQIVELFPTNIYGYFHEGRCKYEKAINIINSDLTASSAKLAIEVNPLLKEARELFVKAKELDTDVTTNAAQYIDDIDYKLEMYK